VNAFISLEDLAVGYGRVPVLEGIHAAIQQGDSIGVLGANGSGKTTLLRTVAGILQPLRGKVHFQTGKRPVIGYVPQRESLDQSFLLSNLEVVEMGLCGRIKPGRFLGKAERQAALQSLERTGAADLAQKRFAEISGGQKQRVLIARALLAQPDLLLLDEPTAGVDAAATAAISELLQRLNSQGITIMMVNHDLRVVRAVARTVWWVRNGDVEQGRAGEMLSRERIEELPIE
jgi:manganese/zinc/iron transport system ATP- binding protein